MLRRLARKIYNLVVAVTFFLFPAALLALTIWGSGPTPEWLLAWAVSLALLIFGRRFSLWLVKQEEAEIYFLTSVPTSDQRLRTGPETTAPRDTGKRSRKKGKQP